VIFILELVCSPAGHCLDCLAWDDETHSENAAAFKLGMLSLPMLPVCGICGSTSARLRNLPTQFGSVEEAARSRKGCHVLC
jgi:hypothetical protein